MSIVVVPSLSREFVRIPLSALDSGTVVDPTGDPVHFAAVAPGTEPTAWTAGEWDTDTTTNPPTYWAQVLVSGTGGGGTIELGEGLWDLWWRVTDAPERPARIAGTVRIT